MSSGILDSSILIDCLRDERGRWHFWRASRHRQRTVMVAAELFAGARDKAEQQQIESFLSSFVIVSPSESMGWRRWNFTSGITCPMEWTGRMSDCRDGAALGS